MFYIECTGGLGGGARPLPLALPLFQTSLCKQHYLQCKILFCMTI
jgi:hypothetical protein